MYVILHTFTDYEDEISNNNDYTIVDNEYGKTNIRMLHLQRDGLKDTIRDLEVDTSLTLDSNIEYTQVFLYTCTGCGRRMTHMKWKETKQQPSTARPGNMLGCCLDYFHFMRAILWPHKVHLVPTKIHPIHGGPTEFCSGN